MKRHINCGDIYNDATSGRYLDDVYEYLKFVTREDSTFSMYRQSASAISIEDGEEYITAYDGYTPVKQSPFGSFAGGVLFGAQGVWIEGMHADDTENIQLIDSTGVTQTPPTTITVRINAVVSGDTCAVFRTSGSSSDVDKWMYNASGTQSSGSTNFWVSGTLETDTPSTGYVRVISGTTEQRLQYSSWVSSQCFVLTGGDTLNTDYSYANGDTAYVPFIDDIANTTTIYKQVLYDEDRNVITRVRHYDDGGNDNIIPFQVAGTVTNAGLTVAAIRTKDTIVT
jgi:hypothetical protein